MTMRCGTGEEEADKENILVFRTNTGAWAMLRTVPLPMEAIDLECTETLSPPPD